MKSAVGLGGAVLSMCLVACHPGDVTERAGADSAVPKPFTLPAEQRERLQVVPVAETSIHRDVTTTGTVGFVQDRSTHVIAAMSGTVSEIVVPLGRTVKSGDLLAKVVSPDFAANVAAYRKSAIAASNLRKIAKTDQELVKTGNIGARELEQAQADAESADADTLAAAEQLRVLGIPAREMGAAIGGKGGPTAQIRSPIEGTVVERQITPGQLLEGGATDCFTIADLSQMWVTANVFESDLAYVAVGDAADITLAAGAKSLPGKVDYVSDVVDPATRAIAVRIVVDNPNHLLKKDAYVGVAIHSAEPSRGLTVPIGALLLDTESMPYVFVVNDDETFSRRRVETGLRMDGQTQITTGLKAGERVVSDGAIFVQFEESK